MNQQMIIRVDSDLKNRVDQFAKKEGKNTSEVIRELMEQYLRERDMSGYLQNLWERIGAKLDPRLKDPKFLDKAIKEIRTEKKCKKS